MIKPYSSAWEANNLHVPLLCTSSLSVYRQKRTMMQKALLRGIPLCKITKHTDHSWINEQEMQTINIIFAFILSVWLGSAVA